MDGVRCSRCKLYKEATAFNLHRRSTRGLQPFCRACQRDYGREYILPALRGRGAAKTLPAWVRSLVRPPETLPAKVIRLADYIRPDTRKHAKRLVVSR